MTLDFIDKPAITHTSRGLWGQGSQAGGLRGAGEGSGEHILRAGTPVGSHPVQNVTMNNSKTFWEAVDNAGLVSNNSPTLLLLFQAFFQLKHMAL